MDSNLILFASFIGLTFDYVGPFLEEHSKYGMVFYANPANR